jgi:hypothetical protein
VTDGGTYTLPTATGHAGLMLIVVDPANAGTGSGFTLQTASGSQKITSGNGSATTYVASFNVTVTVITDGSNWYVVGAV